MTKNDKNQRVIQLPLPLRYLSLVECGDRSGEIPDTHHLRKSEGKPWQLRATICQGPKFVGRRVVVSLGTHDAAEAVRVRDLVLSALSKGGFLAGQVQGPTDEMAPNDMRSAG